MAGGISESRSPGRLPAVKRGPAPGGPTRAQVVVVDEVDRMLDSLSKYATARERAQRARHPRPTRVLLEALVAALRAARRPLQLVACSATVP